VFCKIGFFTVPSSKEARSICEEWLGDELVLIEPTLKPKDFRQFGLNLLGNMKVGGAIVGLYKLRSSLELRCKELYLEDKLIQAKKAIQTKEKNQSLAKC
jgi:hypothetical protein